MTPIFFPEELDQKIIERGRYLFERIEKYKPTLFDKKHWIGRVMDWIMQNDRFKYRLFYFIDIFPSLKTGKSVIEHIREYFPRKDKDLPAVINFFINLGSYGGYLGSKILQYFITFNIKNIGRQFIIGENSIQAVKGVEKLRNAGYAFTIAVLGEATLSDKEGKSYQNLYLELLKDLGRHKFDWTALPIAETGLHYIQDWGYAPISQISIKISGLYSRIKLLDFENSIDQILKNLRPIYRKVIEIEGSLYLDMENYQLKSLTIEVFKRLRAEEEFKHYRHLGIVIQAYLRDSADDLNLLIDWGKNNNLPFEIRLVKGAYWDYEVIVAKQNNWTSRVWLEKSQTDAAFEALAYKILHNHSICYLACGSHNIRSIAAVWEIAKELEVPESRYEFQLLYGMAEPIGKAIKEAGKRVRFYCPYGKMVSGIGYLIRRLLENTSNESFLRQSFSQKLDRETLLRNPNNF